MRVYRDEGVSGTKDLDNRPAFVELMTALHSNGTKLVLVERLDRLARDLMTQETIIGDLRKNGFDLVSVMEPDLLQDDPSRKLMRSLRLDPRYVRSHRQPSILRDHAGFGQKTSRSPGRETACGSRTSFQNS